MTSWNALDTYAFSGLANSATLPAPTSYAAPSTGQAWTDVHGSVWSVAGGLLKCTTDSTNDSAQYKRDFLLAGSSTDEQDQRIVVQYPAAGVQTGLFIALRYQRTGNIGNCYLLGFNTSSNVAQIYSMQGSGNATVTQIGSNAGFTYNSAHAYQIDASAVGVSPTTLNITVTDVTSSTVVANLTVTDSTANLQNAGAMALDCSQPGVSVGNVSTYSQFVSYANAGSGTALAIGTLAATPSQSGITLTLSAALSGGSGTGYGYKIYRGADPNFTANAASLLATVSSLPYTDTSAGQGIEYFYGVVGNDSTAATVNALPAGTGSYAPGGYVPYAGAQVQATALNMVFVGDSITYGQGISNSGTVLSPTMPYFCMTKLKRLLGIRAVAGSNQGHSGHTLTDYAPGGSDYMGAKAAMTALVSATPAAIDIFSIMLGTNDSAQSGTNNSPYTGSLTAAQYTAKLQALVSQMLADFSGCKVFIHLPPWYSPSTHNTSNYEQAGLSALYSYRAATATVVAGYAATSPGQVFLGDTYAFQYFAQNYQAEQQAESGSNGTFYLHPAGTAGSNGLIGTQTLGEMHAQAIAGSLLGGIANRWTH